MYPRKAAFILPFQRSATSTATFTLKTRPWENIDHIVIEAISAHNPDNNNVWAHIGVSRGGTIIYIESLDMADNDAYYVTKNPFTIPEGYRIIVRFSGHASGDKFYVNIFGYTVTYCEK